MEFFERALVSAGRPMNGANDLADFLMTLHTGLMQMTTRGAAQADLGKVVDFSVGCIAERLATISTK